RDRRAARRHGHQHRLGTGDGHRRVGPAGGLPAHGGHLRRAAVPTVQARQLHARVHLPAVRGRAGGDPGATGRNRPGRHPPGTATVAAAAERWSARYRGPGGSDIAHDLAVSPDGSTVYAAGQSLSSSGTSTEFVTVANDTASGDQLWVARYPGSGEGPNSSAN